MVGTVGARRVIDYQRLSSLLTRHYGDDAAQEALLALVSRTVPPDDPYAFCQTVAKRYLCFIEPRQWTTRGHRIEGNRVVHLTDELALTLAGRDNPLDRAMARDELTRVHPLDLALAMGELDVVPQLGDDPPRQPRPSEATHNWRKRMKRKRVREGRA